MLKISKKYLLTLKITKILQNLQILPFLPENDIPPFSIANFCRNRGDPAALSGSKNYLKKSIHMHRRYC
jgi:hypothetical protein